MEWCSKCCLLAIMAVCFGSMCVLGEEGDRIVQAYNDGLFSGNFDEDDEGVEALQNLIGHFINDVDAKNSIRNAIVEDTLDHAQFEDEMKRSGRCRGSGKCILRGPNPNTSSRVLPFGKRGDSPNTLARRGRGSQKNSRARGGRTLLPFGKRR